MTEQALCYQVTVVNKEGIHARCAAQIVKLAQLTSTPIILKKADKLAHADNLMEILLLEAVCDSELELTANHPSAASILKAIKQLIESGFESIELQKS
jgi:phosphotransferase system HPr (HPr) family protein